LSTGVKSRASSSIASRGTALSVGDDEMLAEIPRVGRTEGIFFCPEGAACVAALRRLMESGWLKPEDDVVIFNTASGLKYLDVLMPTGNLSSTSKQPG
jgi:threonine synthase